MDGLETILSVWDFAYFQVYMFVSGIYIYIYIFEVGSNDPFLFWGQVRPILSGRFGSFSGRAFTMNPRLRPFS